MATSKVFRTALGFNVNAVAGGIKKKLGVLDMALVTSEVPCAAAGVFTQNSFQAAPVQVSKKMLLQYPNEISAVIVNSGCANACTADQGVKDAQAMVDKVHGLGLGRSLVMSTGVIGPFLPMGKINAGIESAASGLSSAKWPEVSRAIMTTDTVPKLISKHHHTTDGKEFTITGIAKGAGMIHPNLATMLCVLATDASVTPGALKKALQHSSSNTFNAISVDGDSSTNDSVFVLANGKAGNKVITEDSADFGKFQDALQSTMTDLAKGIVRDGEGATKFVTVRVNGARSQAEAKQIGAAVCRSSLVKTAFYGQDANWGRIICAVGYSGVPIDPTKVSLFFGKGETGTEELEIFKNGVPFDTNEEKASEILKGKDISVRIELGLGSVNQTMWTCDFSIDYVKINADYRS